MNAIFATMNCWLAGTGGQVGGRRTGTLTSGTVRGHKGRGEKGGRVRGQGREERKAGRQERGRTQTCEEKRWKGR